MQGNSSKNLPKIAVYTAIFGNYDQLVGPLLRVDGCDFYCFTDHEDIIAPGYNVIRVKREFDDPTREARKYKCLPHRYLPNYDYTVWIDGSMIIKDTRVAEMVYKALKNKDMAAFKHNERDCVYDELDVCVNQKKDDPKIMKKQVEKYEKEGYPRHNGLFETGILIRKKSPKVIAHNEAWWEEINANSKRDQLSFNYVLWKQNFEIETMPGYAILNPYFYWHAIHGNKIDTLGPVFAELKKKSEQLIDTESRYQQIQKSRLWQLRNKISRLIGRGKL